MSARPPSKLRAAAMWALAGAALALALVYALLASLIWSLDGSLDPELASRLPAIPLVAVCVWVSLLILRRFPGHVVGWLVLALGGLAGAETSTITYSYLADVSLGGRLPFGDVAAWSNWVLALVGLAALLPALPLVFPDGGLPSPRWRPVVWSMALSVVLVGSTAVLTERFFVAPWATNPFSVDVPRSVGSSLFLLLAVVVAANWAVAGAALVARYRGSDRTGRLRLKWFLYGTTVMVLMHGMILLTDTPLVSPALAQRMYDFTYLGPATALFAVATIGIAILRHRLYEIDVVISKTLVYGALAIFIGGVYVAVVVGLGRLAGTGGEPNTALAILATTAIAVAFQPLRRRLERMANRIVYGDRSTPLDAVARFSESMSIGDAEHALREMARVVADASGATAVDVWLRVDDELQVTAGYPTDRDVTRSVALVDGQLPPMPHASLVAPIHHRRELLGALAVTKAPGDPLTGVEEKLVADLADQAGLVLRNRLLTEELRRRVRQLESQAAELTRSRARIVAAHDAERRRLERNIHDGAQQHLVALAVKLGLARTSAMRDPVKALPLMRVLGDDLGQAEQTIAQLAHGLYPETLSRGGIGAALAVEAGRSPLPIRIEDATRHRHPEPIEAAVYFSCLEAIQNALKHARAASITVHLADDDGALSFGIADDGHGFDPSATPPGTGLQSIADRITGVGGEISITSSPATGTRVGGRIPASAGVPT